MIKLRRLASTALIAALFGTLTACGGGNSNTGAAATTESLSLDAQSLPWPAGWIWKPRSEGTGTLVVLPTFQTSLPMTIHNAEGDVVGNVIRRGTHSGKSTIYFNRSGAGFPSPCYLKFDGKYYKNGNPAARRN